MNDADWDIDELTADAQNRTSEWAARVSGMPSVAPAKPFDYSRVVSRPAGGPRLREPHSVAVTILREARLAVKEGLITKAEGRAFCGFPPARRWWKLGR